MQLLDWRFDEGSEDEEFWYLPSKMKEGLKRSTAVQLVSTWIELRCVDIIVAEIGEEFNGIDPLRPVFREKLEATRSDLQTLQTWLSTMRVEVELREPLEEELQETRDWLTSLPVTS